MLKFRKKLNRVLPVITAAALLAGISASVYAYSEPSEPNFFGPFPHITSETTEDEPPDEPPEESTTEETEPPITDPEPPTTTPPIEPPVTTTPTPPPVTVPPTPPPVTDPPPVSDTTTPSDSDSDTTTPPVVYATITLGFYEYNMLTGDSVQLTYQLENAEGYPPVTFSSSDTSVVTVDDLGYITAVGPGIATVYVVTGGLNASAIIGVTDPVKTPDSLEVEQSEFTLNVGAAAQINARLLPEDAAEGYAIIYTSENTAVVTVDGNGLMTAVGEGQTRIHIEGGGQSAYVNVTVSADVAFVTASLSGYLYDGNGKPIAGVHLVVDNLSTVTDLNGYFLFQQVEQKALSIYIQGAEYAPCQFTLDGDTVMFLLFDNNTLTRMESYEDLVGQLAINTVNFSFPTVVLTAGEEYALNYLYEPKDASVTDISYESSNPLVAAVGQIDGVVIAKTPGEAIITLLLNGGQAEATCIITVNPKESTVFSPLIIIIESLICIAAAGITIFLYKRYKKAMVNSLDDEDEDDDLHDIE